MRTSTATSDSSSRRTPWLSSPSAGIWSRCELTVDPSPTRFWAIEWWVYQPETEFRWLMDLERKSMEAGDFLDYNPATRQFTGLLNEWVETSRSLGHPITHVVVEDNAAQRFLLQYQTVHQWIALRGVEIIPHATHRNKSDAEYGFETIAQHYQFGRIRLPAPSATPPGGRPSVPETGRGGHPLPPRPNRRLRDGPLVLGMEPAEDLRPRDGSREIVETQLGADSSRAT